LLEKQPGKAESCETGDRLWSILIRRLNQRSNLVTYLDRAVFDGAAERGGSDGRERINGKYYGNGSDASSFSRTWHSMILHRRLVGTVLMR
jgi:hypothetical protein